MQPNLLRYVIAFCIASLLMIPTVTAQDRNLPIGATQSSALDADHLAQVFLFTSAGDETVELLLSNEIGALLSVSIMDIWGNPLAQASGDPGLTRLVAEISEAGNYYVTVIPSRGETTEEIPFVLTRLGTATIPDNQDVMVSGYPPTQVLTSGLIIDLNWDNTSNLDLEIRDPIGGSLYWDSPSVPSGGTLPANRNGACELLQSEQPERASWPAGALPSGSYEILIYYQDDCEQIGSSEFSIEIQWNGALQHRFSGSLSEGEIYIGRFVIGVDGESSLGLHGNFNEADTLTLAEWDLTESITFRPSETASGTIRNDDHAQAYTFSAVAGDIVSVELVATDGSLDTYLALYDPNGNLIAANDDIDESTHSALRLRTLPISGTYTAVVSRYGKELGGTEGAYNATLFQQSAETATELTALNLPTGDIEVSLLWSTAADLQLLVRDPNGNSIYDDFPTTAYGASLAFAGNVGCSSDLASPVSHIYWPSGTAIPGHYEIDIWYQNSCGDTTPVSFSLYVTVRGQLVYSTVVPIDPGQRYISSFELNLDGSTNVGSGGIWAEIRALDFIAQMDQATEIVGGQATGTLLAEQPYQIYSFEGRTGQVVTINMAATAGTLDTLLYLIDPNGFVLGDNDDAIVGETTDSLIGDIVLPQDGTYLVIATRYGIQFGGTEGPYQLSLFVR
ncbi:MAG: DVUA0089 family protein [Chloroflexi bacterium]|nr:DVUA0089 family protein [Chloroflexota bacterium]